MPFMNHEYDSEAKHGTATWKYVSVLYSTERFVKYLNTSLPGSEYFKVGPLVSGVKKLNLLDLSFFTVK